MSFFKNLFGSKETPATLSEEDLLEVGICPNCWGRQKYDEQFADYVKDQTKSNINHDKQNKKAFVLQFVETNITGVRLKREGDSQVCPTCQSKVKYVSSKAN